MINKKLIKYVNLAMQLQDLGKHVNFIIEQIKKNGATYAITFKTLEKIGYNVEDIEDIIKKSEVWKGFERSFEDMFFDYVELDDDLEA